MYTSALSVGVARWHSGQDIGLAMNRWMLAASQVRPAAAALASNDPGQVVHTNMHLSKNGDALRLGR